MKILFRGFFVLFLVSGIGVNAGAIRNLAGFTVTLFGPNDDGTYPCTSYDSGVPEDGVPTPVAIGFNVNFYGNVFSNLFVNNNGNITFGASLGDFTPFGLVNTESQIIAPFFADVDTRVGNCVTFGNDVVDGHPAFGVDWIGVGYFYENTDKLNSFQLVLIDRSDRNPGDFDIEFNYDSIQWETGDLSGGVDGYGGNSAVVGFSNGSGLPGTSVQLAGSGTPGKFLDLNPNGLIYGSLNSDVPGRYLFSVVNLTNLILNVPRLSQGDPRWGGQSYAGSGATIQQQGSELTTLAMALNYAGVATDPGALNTLLVSSNDYTGNAVNWDAATRDASNHTLRFVGYRTTDAQYLSETLGNGYPVVVGVDLNGDGNPSHFVLVTGEANGHFVINDPGHLDATNLDYFNNRFETRGYVGSSMAPASGLDVTVGNAADILVVDPLGRQTGYDPSSGTILAGIYQSAHFADCPEASDLTGAAGTSTAHQVQLYQPPLGRYQIVLLPKNATASQLSLRAYLADGTRGTSPSLLVTNTPGSLSIFQVDLTATGAVFEPFTNNYVWSVTPTNGPWELTVDFTGPSVDGEGNTITNWYWNFGDGTVSTESNPTHTYVTAAGTFFPSVLAINENGDALASFGPSVVVDRTNLLLNGGFEVWDYGPTAWTLDDDAEFGDGSDPGQPHSGLSSLQLANASVSQTFPTVPGAKYWLSFWLMTYDDPGETTNALSVFWDNMELFDQSNIGPLSWTNLQFLVTADASQATLSFESTDEMGFLYLDDVSVLPQTIVSGISLAGANLVVNGGNGFAGGACVTLASTNVDPASGDWTAVATNILEADGDFTFTATNAVDRAAAQQFYRLQMQ